MSYVRKYAAALAVLVLSSCNAHAAGPQVPAAGSLTGRVASADGKPLAGVVVSDGVRVTQTDTEGMYTLDSDKELGYVFISIPSGYMTAADACAIPQFFARTAKPAGQSERHDFTLTPVD
ncbi:metallophosphoesterase N-terminal domain-containing protein, partial [uncultured Alistipes sp.]